VSAKLSNTMIICAATDASALQVRHYAPTYKMGGGKLGLRLCVLCDNFF
jgi:hypothetical protein